MQLLSVVTTEEANHLDGGHKEALPGVSLDLDPEGCLPKTEELEKAFFTERTECAERSEERGLGGV